MKKLFLISFLISLFSISGIALAEDCGNEGDSDRNCDDYNAKVRAEKAEKRAELDPYTGRSGESVKRR